MELQDFVEINITLTNAEVEEAIDLFLRTKMGGLGITPDKYEIFTVNGTTTGSQGERNNPSIYARYKLKQP